MSVRQSLLTIFFFFFFSSRRRHTRWTGDWSSDVCSSDLEAGHGPARLGVADPEQEVGQDLRPPWGVDHLGVKLEDRKSTRLNSSHPSISYAVFCLKKKKKKQNDLIYTVHKIHNT